MSKILATTAQVILALGVVGLALVAYRYLPLAREMVALRAQEICANTYRLEYTDTTTNTKVISPIEDKYQECVEETLKKTD